MGRNSQARLRAIDKRLEEVVTYKKNLPKKRADGAQLMMRMLARSGAFDARFSRGFFDKNRRQKIAVKITSVVSRCPGETYFWCDSNVGRIRKPVESITKGLLQRTGRLVY